MGPLYTYVHNSHLSESLVAKTMILETLLVVDFVLLKNWNHTYSSLGYGMVQLDLFRVSNKNDFSLCMPLVECLICLKFLDKILQTSNSIKSCIEKEILSFSGHTIITSLYLDSL